MQLLANGLDTYYNLTGPEDAPVVTFSHSLGTSSELWEAQADFLRKNFRVLLYDNRGHGKTAVSNPPYSFEQFAEDIYSLLKQLNIKQTHFIGLSNGGMIAQKLAVMHPEIISSLILCDTTSQPPSETISVWDERANIALSEGMEPLVKTSIKRWLTPEIIRENHPTSERLSELLRTTSPKAYAACCHAIQTFDMTEKIRQIKVPTLLLVGSLDTGTTVAEHKIIKNRIQNSELKVIKGAAHLSNICARDEFNSHLITFLNKNR